MTGKGFRSGWHSGIFLQMASVCLLAVVLAGVWVLVVQAQDEGPVCPPGFDWQRMSGVGCVQEDCAQVGGRLTYTSACICNEGLKACSEPVDYVNFDAQNCGIHCPGALLISCVAPDALCPGEEPLPETPPEPPPPEPEPPVVEPPPASPALLERVEELIVGGDNSPPTAGRAAVAAVTGTVMMGFWSLVQGLGQQTPSVVKRGASGMGKASDKRRLETPLPDLRGAAGGLVKDVSEVIDKWPQGGQGDEDVTIRRPVDSDPGGEVFYGEDARLILIGMDKLPADTAQDARLIIDEGGFQAFAGTPPDGEPQLVRLPSGRELVVAEVISVGYQGAATAEDDSIEIDFSQKFTLIVRLVEDVLEAPTMRALDVDPEDAPTIMRRDADEDPGEDQGEVPS